MHRSSPSSQTPCANEWRVGRWTPSVPAGTLVQKACTYTHPGNNIGFNSDTTQRLVPMFACSTGDRILQRPKTMTPIPRFGHGDSASWEITCSTFSPSRIIRSVVALRRSHLMIINLSPTLVQYTSSSLEVKHVRLIPPTSPRCRTRSEKASEYVRTVMARSIACAAGPWSTRRTTWLPIDGKEQIQVRQPKRRG